MEQKLCENCIHCGICKYDYDLQQLKEEYYNDYDIICKHHQYLINVDFKDNTPLPDILVNPIIIKSTKKSVSPNFKAATLVYGINPSPETLNDIEN